MKELAGKVVWITGASSGIGRSLALQFAREKSILILSSRNKEALQALSELCKVHSGKCYILPIDLLDADGIQTKYQEAIHLTGHIDVLVLNAGISQRSLAYETSTAVDRKIMELNFFSAITLAKLTLPIMMKRNTGHLVVISSLAGKFGVPKRTAYAASKHALQGFFESLRAELASTDVNITIVSPGRISTNISKNALTGEGKAFGALDKELAQGMPVEICAKKILNAVKKEKREILVGGKELILFYIRKFLPPVYHKLITRVNT